MSRSLTAALTPAQSRPLSLVARAMRIGMRMVAKPVLRANPSVAAARWQLKLADRFIPRPPHGTETIAVDAGGVPAERVATPASRRDRHILYLHGGGYVAGWAGLCRDLTWRLATHCRVCVLGVDYRLAPETRFPGALEDCYAALVWLHSSAEPLGIDARRIAIGGESAGGGHAAALAILARDRGEVPLCLQLLDSPMLDDRTGSTADPHPYCGEFVWTPASNRFGWRSLLGVEPGGAEVPAAAVPARAGDLSGLPPAFILVGALLMLVYWVWR